MLSSYPALENDIRSLKKKASEVFFHNRVELSPDLIFHQPSKGGYSSFFAWDSGWNVIALSRLNPSLSLSELKVIYSLQTPYGYIPHEILFSFLRKHDTLLRRFLLYFVKSQFTPSRKQVGNQVIEVKESWMIDPPSFLIAPYRYYENTGDENVFSFIPFMENVIAYLSQSRSVSFSSFSHLPILFHPWESGTDASPVFDKALGFSLDTSPLLRSLRILKLAFQFIKILNKSSHFIKDFNAGNVSFEKFPFIFLDSGFIGLFLYGFEKFLDLLEQAGETLKVQKHYKTYIVLKENFRKAMWNDKEKRFFSLFWKDGKWYREETLTLSSVIPLLSNTVSLADKKESISRYLLSSEHFLTPYPFSFVSLNEIHRSKEGISSLGKGLLWRGPCVWMNMVWLVLELLISVGFVEDAQKCFYTAMKMVKKEGFREYYNALNGKGYGMYNFTWPSLLFEIYPRIFNKALPS